MVGTHIEFDNTKQHVELRKKALDLGLDLRELMIGGALSYKPKKGDPIGMELYMDNNEIPKDFYNKEQWKKYIKATGKNQKFSSMFRWLLEKVDV